MMKQIILSLLLIGCISCSSREYNNGYIRYSQVKLSGEEKQILRDAIEKMDEQYDPEGKMIIKKIDAWNYHTDALEGIFHEVRASFYYAVYLLDLGDDKYKQRALEVIHKTLSLQDTDPASPSCGVWPYYEEEPLATKKSPIDYNWADFNAVSLLDIYMGHKERLPQDIQEKIQKALILAAHSIQKRNVGPGYTNIAIMGTYVTYLVSHLFEIPDMQEYAVKRLEKFYKYTLEKGGFTEYNSPTYTIVALDELERMKRHIVEPSMQKVIDSLYEMGWEMIARHYHKSSSQWSGPHSRTYHTLVRESFYGILYQASAGRIDLGYKPSRSDVKIRHKLPDHLYSYFLNPSYPRIEKDVFEINEPRIIGTSYLTEQYTLSTANRSSLWNQRRPFLVYWGNLPTPHYLQPRLLHNLYDFSTATFFSEQQENKIIAAINFGTNGGDKHISIDRLQEGRFVASDLRLRFEIGNFSAIQNWQLPENTDDVFSFEAEGLTFHLKLFYSHFGGLKGYWEKGGDGTISWIDYVIYSGPQQEIDLQAIDRAALGFAFIVKDNKDKELFESLEYTETNGILEAVLDNLQISVPVKPGPCANHL